MKRMRFNRPESMKKIRDFVSGAGRLKLQKAVALLPPLAVFLLLSTLVVYFISSAQVLTTVVSPMTEPFESSQETTQDRLPDRIGQAEWTAQEFKHVERGDRPEATSSEPALPAPVTDPTLAYVDWTVATEETTKETTATTAPTETKATEKQTKSTTTADVLNRDRNGIIQEPLAPEAFKEDDATVYVRVNRCNLRSEPNTGAAVLLTATTGDSFKRLAVGTYWSRVAGSDGNAAYIYNDFITTNVVEKPKPPPVETKAPAATEPKQTTTEPTETKAPEETTATQQSSGLSEKQQADMIALAKAQLGTRYVFAGSKPGGFDCSGFTLFIYREILGINLPHRAVEQATRGQSVKSSQIQVGDIICFDWSSPYGQCDHVGLYIGGGQYIHASSSKKQVVQSELRIGRDPILTIRRIVP